MRNGAGIPELNVQVIHPEEQAAKGATPCAIGKHIKFDEEGLRGYRAGKWEPRFQDAMLVAAAAEACDLSLARPAAGWARRLKVSVPVDEPERWISARGRLERALGALTGDSWAFRFTKALKPPQSPEPKGERPTGKVDSVIVFRESIDSLAVEAAMERSEKSQTARARVDSRENGQVPSGKASQPFARAPFSVSPLKTGGREASRLSRGFKFAALGGLAACASGARRVIMPESGQSALGPSLASPQRAWPDQGAHPRFTALMQELFRELFCKWLAFEHPAIWKTKGESVAECHALAKSGKIWRETRSCEASGGHGRENGMARQCGVCAACMLRRSSLHAAGCGEDPGMYIWEDLSASDFWAATRQNNADRSKAQLDRAIAGVLRMDQLAALPLAEGWSATLERQALALATALGISFDDAEARIERMVEAHADEWRSFIQSLPKQSFVRSWGAGGEKVSASCLSPGELGRRLRLAREGADLTRERAEALAKLPKAAVAAIERGERAARDDEILSLADAYSVDMSRIMRPEAIHAELAPRFKKLRPAVETSVKRAAKALGYFASAEAELEAALGMSRPRNLPPERALRAGGETRQAQADALRTRRLLGLGKSPVRGIFQLLEHDLGIRIYAHPLDSQIFGLFAYDDRIGACVLVNSSHRYERQVETCAHELGHVITARRRPDLSCDRPRGDSSEERYASAFSSAFLMPAETVRREFRKAVGRAKRLSRRHVIALASRFSAPRESLAHRLEELELAPRGTWSWFMRNGGITDAHAEEALGIEAATEIPAGLCPEPAFLRLKALAGEAMAKGILSEGQVSDLLKIDLALARQFRIDEETKLDDADEFYL